MAYRNLPGNFDSMNESQRNEAAIGAGYTGYNDYLDQKNRGLAGGGGSSMPMPTFQQPTIDLQGMYKNLFANSGINETQAQIDELTKKAAEKEQAKNVAVAGTNDNPWYAEATRTGRIAKVTDAFNNDITALTNQAAPLSSKIATKKADIETSLNLATKQFDIDSQQAQMARQQFNDLLTTGALDSASPEDIANLTRSTGISSSMIQSAIDTRKKSNVKTDLIQFDDGKEQGFVVVDGDGNIINKQVIAQSKATKTGGSEKLDYPALLKQDAKAGLTLSQIFDIYLGYITADEILRLYNASSKYGADKGDIKNLAKYGVTQPKTTGRST